jgi:hypothetical protein
MPIAPWSTLSRVPVIAPAAIDFDVQFHVQRAAEDPGVVARDVRPRLRKDGHEGEGKTGQKERARDLSGCEKIASE